MSAGKSLTGTARTIFAEALAACSVEQAFLAKLEPVRGSSPFALRLRGGSDEPVTEIDLSGTKRLIVIAAGKGAATMLHGLLHGIRMPEECELAGVLIAPERPAQLPMGIEYFTGGHPLPTPASFAGARAALSMIQHVAANADRVQTFCFFLISGGASAMMELPLDGSISLEDTIAFHRALVHSGASIAEINCVRKHFSAVKGGRLGQAAAKIPNLTILVSDVPAGQLDALASGPTLPDRSTVAECLDVLQRYGLTAQFPASVRDFFQSTELPETPKPGAFPARVSTLLSADDLADAARRQAESLGFTVVVDNTCDDWDYAEAAEYLLARLRALRQEHARICLISSGEVTVQVDAYGGVGGRNQHFALYAAGLLEPSDGSTAIFSAGSDGIDGNSPFAGAVLDYAMLQAAHASLPEGAAQQALQQFNTSSFLERMQATIRTGPTGNNLRDLRLLVWEE